MFNKDDAADRMEKATVQLQEWKDKLDKFHIFFTEYALNVLAAAC